MNTKALRLIKDLHTVVVRAAICATWIMAGVPAEGQVAPGKDNTVRDQTVNLPATQSTSSQETPAMQGREAWRKSMARIPLPHGCFKAAYPETAWQKVQCTTPPTVHYRPAQDTRNYTVGAGTDYAAQVSSSVISLSQGGFITVTGVTSEVGGGSANSFSLQINTNLFSTPQCSASSSSSCKGWQQFVFGNPNTSNTGESEVVIEYWLIGYISTSTPSCPTGWEGDGGRLH